MVLVDSSVWIEAARRDGSLEVKVGLESLLDEDEATWCGVVKLEFLGGARPGERERLAHHLACVPYLAMTDRIWNDAKESSWKLRDRGFAIPWNDILVGTLALRQGCRAYALDKHFQMMEQVLGLRLYRPDYGGKFRPEAEL